VCKGKLSNVLGWHLSGLQPRWAFAPVGNIKKMLTLALQYRVRPEHDVRELLNGCFEFICQNNLKDTFMLWLCNPEDHGFRADKEFLLSTIKFFLDGYDDNSR
jgi:hypothetical protein